MKKYSLLLGMAFAAFLTGCTDDNFGNKVQNPVQVGDDIQFGTSISGDAEMIETRTVYGDRTSTGIPVYWKEEGDSVAIFCPQASAPADKLVTYLVKPAKDAQGNLTNGSASVTAQVNPGEAGLQWGNAPTHRFYAFYPAKSVKGTEDDGKIKSNIPVEQDVVSWRHGTMTVTENGVKKDVITHFGLPNMDFAYMYACDSVITADIDKNESINLKFHNLLTVLDITIPGPETGTDPVKVTSVYVDAVSDVGQDGHEPILTGDFYCYLRPGQGHDVGYCEPVNPNPTEVSNRIAISTYDLDKHEFIELRPGEQINVKAYILPHTAGVIEKQSLRISVSTMNGTAKMKTLMKAQVKPGKINRVRLPYLEQSNDVNYWMSNLDPNVYFTELSFPGSHQSVGTQDENVGTWPVAATYEKYQTADLETQFKDGVRAFSFQTYHSGTSLPVFASGREQEDLSVYFQKLTALLETAKKNKKSDFVLVSLVWKDMGWGDDATDWYNDVANLLNSPDYQKFPIYRGKIDANTTIGELANQIVLRIDRTGEANVPGLTSEQPSRFAPAEKDLYWGNNTGEKVLTMYAHDGTSIDVVGNKKGEIDNLDDKLGYIKTIFSESVKKYLSNDAHNYFYHTNIGGFYCIDRDLTNISDDANGGHTVQYTKDIMEPVTDYIQARGQNASLGVVLMNFADKQKGSGVAYKCDNLIQTIIYNNFSFALRKKPGTTTPTRSEYVTRMSTDENQWDE